MAEILVLGGGVCGLGTALMLARDGHEVTVLERDPQPPPASAGEAWQAWERRGVAQFHQPHFVQARGRHVLDTELPDVRDALLAAGAVWVDQLGDLPSTVDDRASRPDDDRFRTITGRRPVVEYAFARAAQDEPRVDVRRGVTVTDLVTGASALSGVPHVVGVRTAAGDVVRADLVVDAMGRRSVVPRLLEAAGARPCYEEAEDCGFMYFTRYFQRRAGGPRPATPFVSAVGSFSILTLPSDRDTWSLTVFASSHDRPLTRLRHTDRWTAVVAACPQYADALDGEPLTDVLPMSGVIDRYRRLTVEGTPVATGIALVADAWACTNPSVGRGITLGLMHAARLREVVRTELGKPAVFADAWDAATESDLTPWYRFTVQGDRARLAQIDALREGREVEVPADPRSTLVRSMFVAMRYDADVYRAVTEVGSCQALPQEVFDRPGMVDRIMAVALGREAPPAAPGPTRAELLALLS